MKLQVHLNSWQEVLPSQTVPRAVENPLSAASFEPRYGWYTTAPGWCQQLNLRPTIASLSCPCTELQHVFSGKQAANGAEGVDHQKQKPFCGFLGPVCQSDHLSCTVTHVKFTEFGFKLFQPLTTSAPGPSPNMCVLNRSKASRSLLSAQRTRHCWSTISRKRYQQHSNCRSSSRSYSCSSRCACTPFPASAIA